MANLIEQAVWQEGIYQLETSDPVMGGPDGVDNRQAKQLANRTAYLKQVKADITYVEQVIANLVNSSPEALDTLQELAAALGDDPNFSATILAKIAEKADANAFASLQTFLIGLPLPYPKTTVPTGCLALRGQSISQSTYPVLYNLYGGTLPDLRGEFIRGWDNGRGIDSGRGILSAQGDAIRNITGSVRTDNGWMFRELRGAFFDHSGGEDVQQLRNQVLASDSNSAPTVGWFDFDASKSGVPTAAENRPRNIAMQYICLAG